MTTIVIIITVPLIMQMQPLLKLNSILKTVKIYFFQRVEISKFY